MPDRPPNKPGLQAERTLLSWERSAFGFLVGGALILLRQHGPLGPGRTLLTLIATLLALLVLGVGYWRARRVKASRVIAGRVVIPAPRTEVLLIGCATVLFSTAIVVALANSW